jgi:hypothetical protein
MYALATCTASILRGTGTDVYGDVYDNGTVAASGIPASIIVRSKSSYDPATQTPRVIQQIVGAVGSDVDIKDSDQLRDDTSGITYAIESVTQPNAPGLTPDLQLELRRVT